MINPYACDLMTGVEQIDARDWDAICTPDGNPFIDRRFLRAVATSFATEARFWYAIFRDDDGRPVACTCFSQYLVDGALMAPAGFQKMVAWIRRVWPTFFKYKMLLGGLPVSTCGNQLAVRPDVDYERLTAGLHQVADRLARQNGCGLISFKEFAPEVAAKVSGLAGHDYLQGRSVVAYSLAGDFESFEQYQASRSKRTRANIRRHFRKFDEAGLTFETLRGRDGVDQLFTADVHRLYLNVLDRADVRFERIPLEFFQELARQLPDESCFTFMRKGDRIVGFCCGVASRGAHTLLFCGLDYSLNADADLYFNIIFRGLAQGLTGGVRVVHIGASADEFKKNIGCRGESLSVYVNAVGAVRQFVFRRIFGLLFDTHLEAPPTDQADDAKRPLTVPEPTETTYDHAA